MEYVIAEQTFCYTVMLCLFVFVILLWIKVKKDRKKGGD